MHDIDRYTIIIDVFKPEELFTIRRKTQANSTTTLLKDCYIDILQQKGQLEDDFGSNIDLNNWSNKVFNSFDIFTELGPEKRESITSSNKKNPPKLQVPYLRKSNHSKTIDHRFTRIEVTPIDMLRFHTNITTKNGISVNEIFNEPLKAKTLGYGVIRLYNDWEKKRDINELDVNKVIKEQSKIEVVEGDKTMVAIIAIPSYFTATELLGFVGEEARKEVSHFRLIRSQAPNRFMALMKFKKEEDAIKFHENFNGRYFNSMEPETCHVVFIEKILFRQQIKDKKEIENDGDSDSRVNSAYNIPYLLGDPFTTVEYDKKKQSQNGKKNKSKLVELPTCPVCLERMDSTITGLLTIQCQHTFHCECLSKWDDDSCPVCRYTSNFDLRIKSRVTSRLASQVPTADNSQFNSDDENLSDEETSNDNNGLLHGAGNQEDELEEEQACAICEAKNNLWICLICGNVGCGRYDKAHAMAHFNETMHCFAMDCDSQRVWDYVGDNYVHRLIQNEADGKLVELPDEKFTLNVGSSVGVGLRNNLSGDLQNLNIQGNQSDIVGGNNGMIYFNSNNNGGSSMDYDRKLEKVGFEYSKMLISQLESQREYYEYKYSEIKKLKEDEEQNNKELQTKVSLADEILKNQEKQAKDFKNLKGLYKDLSKKFQDEKSINEGLSKKIDYLISENDKLKTDNEELKQQVQDMMFYLSSQEKFKDASDEVKNGQIVMKKKGRKN